MHAIYVRVSTEDQAQKGYSIPSQLEACRQVIPPGQEMREFVDDGYSGASLDRPALERLRDLIRTAREPVHVVCYDPDRLSRSLVHLLLLTEEFSRQGSLRFISMSWEDTPEGRLFLSMRGAVAEFERAKIRERSLRGKRQKAKEGRIACVPQHLLGYRFDPATDTLSVEEPEAEVVREIYRLCLEGEGTSRIARALNRRGWRTSRGNRWQPTTVLRVLRNPDYIGEFRQFRGSNAPLLLSIPPIVDRETWLRVQQALEDRRRQRSGPASEKALLSGILTCGGCGSRFYTNYRERNATWYICRRKYRTVAHPEGLPLCTVPNQRASLLDPMVWQEILERLRQPLEAWERMMTGDGEGPTRLQRVRGEMQRLRQGRQRLLLLVAQGAVSAEEAGQALAGDRVRMERLHQEERELDADGSLGGGLDRRVWERIGALQSGRERGGLAMGRRVLHTLVEGVVVFPDGRIRIRPRQ